MSNTKLFYSYKDTNNTGKVPVSYLSSYSDSIIFDEDNRRLWHNGKQYGNTYWGTKHGETFNNIDKNYANNYAHAEGSYSYAAGESSHVEGISNSAYGVGSHAEGNANRAFASYSHIEGVSNYAYGVGSHAEGLSTKSSGYYSHAQGNITNSVGDYSDAQGVLTVSFGIASHSEGILTYASSYYSHAEGEKTSTYGNSSHAEGWLTSARGTYSHAEGENTSAYGSSSHTEGISTKSIGTASHAEGERTSAYGGRSHAEGTSSITYGSHSHAEGQSTIAYGNASHSEGLNSKTFGPYSHAEGENTYAAGRCSHTQGLGTVAYNEYEAAFGKYNNSVTTGNKTIYSIGNGISSANRKNIIDFRENGDMHKNGSSYFHNNIYGPVSYTYVKTLGEKATLDIVLSSVLVRPEYTRPKIEVQYKLSNGSSFKTVNSTSSCEETVELGTYFYPEFKVVWPTRTQTDVTGTRAYDAVCLPSKPNYLLGYSYGVSSNGITILYNNGGGKNNTNPNSCNSTYTAYALDTLHRGATSPCYILGETTYTLFNNLKISYLPFSYMYFPQLYNNGVYVHSTGLSPKEWLNGGTYSLGGYKVRGRLKYYWGFSGDSVNPGKNHPTNETVLKGQNFGWLNPIGKTEINTGSIGITNASKYCLWIAYPDTNDSLTNALIKNKHFTLVNNPNNNFKIEVLMKDGMNFDLVSPNQPLKSTYMNINLANKDYNIRYKISYIDFQKPIGNVNDVLKFIIESNIT